MSGDNKNFTPLYSTTKNGRGKVLRFLLNNDKIPKDSNGWTPIHHAAKLMRK